MDDQYRYVYLADDGQGMVTIWPLEDSPEVLWQGRPVLTKNESHRIKIEYCEGYVAGTPGYYLAELDGDPPEICLVQPGRGGDQASPDDDRQLSRECVKPNKARICGAKLEFPSWPKCVADRAANHEYVLLAKGTGLARLCCKDTGVKAWHEEVDREIADAEKKRQMRREARKHAELEELLKRLHDSGMAFVNPYTFVPLPQRVAKCEPNGHARAVEDALTGYIDIEYQFKTPLMMASDWHPAGGANDDHATQRIDFPGSSVRGSVRSLYEVLTNSCLHVLDPDYLPVHRSELGLRPGDRLAVVDELDDSGRVHTVLPTKRVIWAKVEALQERLCPESREHHCPGTVLKSGLRLDLSTVPVRSKDVRPGTRDGRPIARDELDDAKSFDVSINPEGAWVVHVADAGAKGTHPFTHVYVALGELENQPVEIGPDVWEEFRELCRGSKDVKAGCLASTAPEWNSQDWPGIEVQHRHNGESHTVGLRRKSDGMLARGDSIWLVCQNQHIVGLKMALNWREKGRYPVRDRLPDESLLPCCDPGQLCPACSVFGFVEQHTGPVSDKSQQNAYASHVRFTGFHSDGEVKLWREPPPPMRSPRASAGAFYLLHHEATEDEYRQAGTPALGRPTSRWGSPLDKSRRRPIAGRKFYWHGQQPDDTRPTPRQKQRRGHQFAEVNPGPEQNPGSGHRWFAPVGTRLRGRVLFENLVAEQVGFLLMALNPQLLANTCKITEFGELATHLGGGKGLGYGSAVVTGCEVHLENAVTRYLTQTGTPGDEPDQQTAIQTAAKALAENQAPVADLAKALGLESVPADRIWYPTMGNFKRRGEGEEERFDKSFDYYARFSGGKAGVPMRTLPRIDDPNQYMTKDPNQYMTNEEGR